MSYISNTKEQQQEMLKACGVSSIEELFSDIPPNLKPKSFSLPCAKSELEVYEYFKQLAFQNCSNLTYFLGAGFYDHYIPAAVDAIVSRSEFYTAYTPYQPEISQGTLQAIYEYQTQICRITGMDVSNASLYDGGTAFFEASQMAIRETNKSKIIIDSCINPIYKKMLSCYTSALPINIKEIPHSNFKVNKNHVIKELDNNTAAFVFQNPNFFGIVEDYEEIINQCHLKGILVIELVYPISLSILKTPAEMNVDIVVGEGQSLGIPLSFGGPYLGFIATTKKLVRKLPGRIVGKTIDNKGKQAFVLTLQAREQHIRREKATSNICTNSALCALRAHVYLSLLGKKGFKELGLLCYNKAEYTKELLRNISGIKIDSNISFNEFLIELPVDALNICEKMMKKGIIPGCPMGIYYKDMQNFLLVAVTEKRTKKEICNFTETLKKCLE